MLLTSHSVDSMNTCASSSLQCSYAKLRIKNIQKIYKSIQKYTKAYTIIQKQHKHTKAYKSNT